MHVTEDRDEGQAILFSIAIATAGAGQYFHLLSSHYLLFACPTVLPLLSVFCSDKVWLQRNTMWLDPPVHAG